MKAREIENAEECVRLNREIERWRTATAKMRDAMEESARVANAELAEATRSGTQWQLDAEKYQRENDALRCEMMDLKAEIRAARKEWIGDDFDHLPLGQAIGAMRAQITAEAEVTLAELVTDGNAVTLAANLAKVTQRNAELEAALRDACAKSAGTLTTTQILNILDARAESAESAAPAKHPDTELLEWMELNHRTVMAFADGSFSCWSVDGYEFHGNTARAAIDAARKQGGAK